jgi:hypothetical protein
LTDELAIDWIGRCINRESIARSSDAMALRSPDHPIARSPDAGEALYGRYLGSHIELTTRRSISSRASRGAAP